MSVLSSSTDLKKSAGGIIGAHEDARGLLLTRDTQTLFEKDLKDAEDRLNAKELALLRALKQQQSEKKRVTELLSNFDKDDDSARRRTTDDKQDEEETPSCCSNKKTPSEEALGALEFFQYVIQCAGKKYGKDGLNDFSFRVEPGRHELLATTKNRSAEEIIDWARTHTISKGETVECISMVSRDTMHYFEKHDFTKAEADRSFGLVVGNCHKLVEFLQEQLFPINDQPGSGVLAPNRSYVKIHGDDNAFRRLDERMQLDKSFAILVAGESGSGKSVLSCLEVMDRGYLPMYVSLRLRKKTHKDEIMTNDANGDKDETKRTKDKFFSIDVSDLYETKPTSEYHELHEFLSQLLSEHQGNVKAVNVLCDIKLKINVTLCQWANSLLEGALRRFVREDNNARNWLEGHWKPAQLPRKVAIILDDVTDIDLVKALVENGRITKKKLLGIVKNDVVLVFTGTGIDAAHDPTCYGKNPSSSRLVNVKGPNLEAMRELGGISEEVYNAVTQGLYSSILKTNSRMLFRSVLPLFQQDFLTRDGDFDPKTKKRRLEERLTQVASFGPFMDCRARHLFNKNIFFDLSREERESLVAATFLQHLIAAIANSKKNSSSMTQTVTENQEKELALVRKMRRDIKVYSDDVFERGLAARFGTSRALKYFACFGSSYEVRVEFGNEFEELTALHYMRLMEVQSNTVKRVVLNHAWPPKSNENETQETEILRLKAVLKDQADTELIDLTCPWPSPFCVVFSQRTPTAHGGNVLVLLANTEGVCELECIQCKHYKSTQGEDVLSWWSSLGVACDQDGECNVKPDKGKAGYSYAGLDAFRRLLEEKIGRPVSLGRRTMAVSFPMPPRENFPIPKDDCARVWFREMLEPTISTFELRPQHGHVDDAQRDKSILT